MPAITATHINYFHICKYKLWLFSHGIAMEHNSQLVLQGNVLHKNAYRQRSKRYREIQLGGSKIDYYDPKRKLIHEVKKSDAMSKVDIWQIKYYLWIFETHGIMDVQGQIEYPTQRETVKIKLKDEDRLYLRRIIRETKKILSAQRPPKRISLPICPSCAYYDFCWVTK